MFIYLKGFTEKLKYSTIQKAVIESLIFKKEIKATDIRKKYLLEAFHYISL